MKTPNRAQREVLALLEVKPRETSRTTHHEWVSGQCVGALVRLGWARVAERMAEITDAGRAALQAANAERSAKLATAGTVES